MKKAFLSLMISTLGAFSFIPLGLCESLKVAPSEVVSISADHQEAQLAARFALQDLREGEGREIFRALLEWPLAGIDGQTSSEYALYAIEGAWSATSAAAGTKPALVENSEVLTECSPLDYQRNGHGFVRFDVTDLVRAWTEGIRANDGLFMVTRDATAEAFLSKATEARLVISYGFLPTLGN